MTLCDLGCCSIEKIPISVIICPALLNSLSDGELLAGIARYFRAS